MTGGYQTVSFGDVNITSDGGATVVGIYEAIEGTYRKAIMVGDVTIDGVAKRSCFVECEAGENSFTFSAYGKTFTVTHDDKVTIA